MSIHEITSISEFKIRRQIFGRNSNCGVADNSWFHPIIIELTKRTIQYLIAWRDGYRDGHQMYRDARLTRPFISL